MPQILHDEDTGLTHEFPDDATQDQIQAALDSEKSSTARRFGDLLLSGAQGVIGLPESLVGLADIPTFGGAGKLAEKAGVRFKEARDIIEGAKSPEQQEANRKVREAQGFFDTVGTALQNPSTIASTVVESIPSMFGGSAIARGAVLPLAGRFAPAITKSLGATAPLLAGSVGEGAISAGQTAEQVRQSNESGFLTLKQSAIAAGSGTATAVLGALGGKMAKWMGAADIDTLAAGGVSDAAKKLTLLKIAKSALSEGVLEELPQSAQEQAAQNVALGKPWDEGVAEAAAMGAFAGLVMGGFAGGVESLPQRQKVQDVERPAIRVEDIPFTESPIPTELQPTGPPNAVQIQEPASQVLVPETPQPEKQLGLQQVGQRNQGLQEPAVTRETEAAPTPTAEDLIAKIESLAQRYAKHESTSPEDDLLLGQIGDDKDISEAFMQRVAELRGTGAVGEPHKLPVPGSTPGPATTLPAETRDEHAARIQLEVADAERVKAQEVIKKLQEAQASKPAELMTPEEYAKTFGKFTSKSDEGKTIVSLVSPEGKAYVGDVEHAYLIDELHLRGIIKSHPDGTPNLDRWESTFTRPDGTSFRAHGEYAEFPNQGVEYVGGRTHRAAVEKAISEGRPFSIEAAKAYGINPIEKPVVEESLTTETKAPKSLPQLWTEALEGDFVFHAASKVNAKQIRAEGIAPGSWFAKTPREALAFAKNDPNAVIFAVRKSDLKTQEADAEDVFGQEFQKADIFERSSERHFPVLEVVSKGDRFVYQPVNEPETKLTLEDAEKTLRAGGRIASDAVDQAGLADELARRGYRQDKAAKQWHYIQTENIPRGVVGSTFSTVTPLERVRVQGNWELMELSQLVPSSDPGYDASLQPRDRNRQASKEQISKIAREMEPESLMDSPIADDGAPIIDDRNQVLSGNARVGALQIVYGAKTERAAAYRQHVIAMAQSFGISPAEVEKMAQPVLVRRVSDYNGLSKAEFARQANQQKVMGMSAAEKASSDATALRANPGLMAIFLPSEEGDVLAASNRVFVNGFIQAVGDRAELVNSDGSYNAKTLVPRIKNAVLGALLGAENRQILDALIDRAQDLGIAKVATGLMASAPSLTFLKGTEYDLAPSIIQALTDLIDIKTRQEKIEDFLGQSLLFGDPKRTAESDFLLTQFYLLTSAKQITEGLKRYVSIARKIVQDIFGSAPPTRTETLKVAFKPNEPPSAATSPSQENLTFGKSETPPGSAKPQTGPAPTSIPQKTEEPPAPTTTTTEIAQFGSKNALVTTAEKDELLRRMKEKLKQGPKNVSMLGTGGLDPSFFTDAVRLGAYYIEGGFHRFVDWIAQLRQHFTPEEISDKQLRSIYETARVTIESPSSEGRIGQPPGLQPGLRPPADRIITARQEFTQKADETIIPQEIVKHLDPHQRQDSALAINSMEKRGGFLNSSGTGAGKTRVAITVARYYAGKGMKVIIVAPKNPAGIDWKKNTFSGSYGADSNAMGVKIKLTRDAVVKNGEIGLTTYENLSAVERNADASTILIFDEGHFLKNDSQRAKHAMRAINRASKVLFMSATPADKPEHIYYLAPIGIFEGKTIQRAMQDLGMALVEMKGRDKDGRQYTFKKWVPDQNVTDTERNQRFSALFDRMTANGAMVKREISMDGVHVQVLKISLPPEAHAVQADILRFFDADHIDDLTGLKRAIVLGHQRRQQEPFKIASTIMLTQRELAAARQVVIFLHRVNESEVGKWTKVTGIGGESERIRETLMRSEGTAKTMREALEDAGIHDIAEIHGNSDQTSIDAMADFQAGRKRVVIATIESGGAGINLDDTIGNRPRTIIMMTAPFDAVGNVQAAGRIWRLKTLSGANLFYLFADTNVDDWNADIIGSKMSTLGAVVEGQVRRLDISNPESVSTDDYHENVRETKPDVAPSAPTEFPSMDWKPFKTKAGQDKFVAPATNAFWTWYNANGKAQNPLGLRVSKWQGAWQVWSDKPISRQSIGATVERPTRRESKSESGFYSRINRTVEQSPQGRATGAQWKALIRNSKLGFPQAEWDYRMLASPNALEDGTVYTKSEVLEFLKANEVVVQDVTLGENRLPQGFKVNREPDNEYSKRPDWWRRENPPGWHVSDENGNLIGQGKTHDEAIADAQSNFNLSHANNPLDRNATYFSTYQLPGAIEGSYREVLLTVTKAERLPDDFGEWSASEKANYESLPKSREGTWRDGHSQYSSIANPIVRLRFNERTTADGKRMIFLEEVQAPQKGEFEKMPALFQKNWREIAFKWALRHAAENGFDSVGWATGAQQAERYSLEKQVDEIKWGPVMAETAMANKGNLQYVVITPKGLPPFRFYLDGNGIVRDSSGEIEGKHISDVVGKDVAEKIQSQHLGTLSGEGLKIGGEGLKKLYDVDFRNVVNNLPAVKRAGQKVGMAELITGKGGEKIPDGAGGLVETGAGRESIHSLELSPAIRESVMAGQAQFARGSLVANPITEQVATQAVNERLGTSVIPVNIRFVNNGQDPAGHVLFLKGFLPQIVLNLSKIGSTQELIDILHEELIHPLQQDPQYKALFDPIAKLVTAEDIQRQLADKYAPDVAGEEAVNELTRRLADRNIFQRLIDWIVRKVKELFRISLNKTETARAAARTLLQAAVKNQVSATSGEGFAEPPGEYKREVTERHGIQDSAERVVLGKPERDQGVEYAKEQFAKAGFRNFHKGNGDIIFLDANDREFDHEPELKRLLELVKETLANRLKLPDFGNAFLDSVREEMAKQAARIKAGKPVMFTDRNTYNQLTSLTREAFSLPAAILGMMNRNTGDNYDELEKAVDLDLRIEREIDQGYFGGVGSDAVRRVIEEIKRQIGGDISSDSAVATAIKNILMKVSQPEPGSIVYKIAQGRLKPKQKAKLIQQLNHARNQEAAQFIIEIAKANGVQEPPAKTIPLTATQKLLEMVKPSTAEKMDKAVAEAVRQAERNAGFAAWESETRATPDDIALYQAETAKEGDGSGIGPTPAQVAKGMDTAEFAHWRVIRDNLLGYSPVTDKLIRQVIKSEFKGTDFSDPTKPKSVDPRVLDLNELARQPDAEVNRVFQAYLDTVEAGMDMQRASPITKQRILAAIQSEIVQQLEMARTRINDPYFAPKRLPHAKPSPEQAIREALNTKLFNDPRLVTDTVSLVASKAAVQRLLPKMSEIIQTVLSTPVKNQRELGPAFADEVLTKLDVDPSQAEKAGEVFEQAYRTKFNAARESALEKAGKRLSPEEKTVLLQNGKQLFNKISDFIRAGGLDSHDFFRQFAKEKWGDRRVPSDADIEKLRAVIDRIDTLTQLTPQETAKSGGDAAKLAAARKEKLAVNDAEIRLLQRQAEAMIKEWGAPTARTPREWLTDPVLRRNWNAARNELSSANVLLGVAKLGRQLIDTFTMQLFYIPHRAIAQTWNGFKQPMENGQEPSLIQLYKNYGHDIGQALKIRIATIGHSLRAFEQGARGRGLPTHIEQLQSGMLMAERLNMRAETLANKGDNLSIIRSWLMRLWALQTLGHRQFASIDVLQAKSAIWQEMMSQTIAGLRRRGLDNAQIQTHSEAIFGNIAADLVTAKNDAESIATDSGRTPTEGEINADAWELLQTRLYARIKALELPADDFERQNKAYAETIAWNRPPQGPGALYSESAKRLQKYLERWFPIPPLFGNAIGTSLNRAITYAGFGLFPEMFSSKNARGEKIYDPWYESDVDKLHRRTEAITGLSTTAILGSLALLGAIVIRLGWPKDKKEREEWQAKGFRPYTVEFPLGNGTALRIPLRIGPLAPMIGSLAAFSAVRTLLDKKNKEQQKLNEDAARLGVAPDKATPISTADILGVAASAGLNAMTGGRTASGMLGTYSDFGTLNVGRVVSGYVSSMVPLLPAYQELTRLAGVQIDPSTGNVWDLLVPNPWSQHRRVNMLGDDVSAPGAVERIFDLVTLGSGVTGGQAAENTAYANLYATGARPSAISRTKGYDFNGTLRPMTREELATYARTRGTNLKEALMALGPVDGMSPEDAKAAVQSAIKASDQKALASMGVTVAAPRQSASGTTRRASSFGRRSSFGSHSRSLRPSRSRGYHSTRRFKAPSLISGRSRRRLFSTTRRRRSLIAA